MAEDWRDSLRSLLGDTPAVEEPATEPIEARPTQTGRLDIIVERKGRGGKVATIVTGFTLDDEDVAEVAASLKRKLGTGGSARGGEILIQGDRARNVLDTLTAMGYKARII